MLKEIKNLTDKDVYEYYKEHRKKPVVSINRYNIFKRAVSSFLDIIYTQVVENEDGVHIEGLGYFFNRLISLAKPIKSNLEINPPIIRRITGKYRPSFMADDKLSAWHYDRGHNSLFTNKIRIIARAGKKYKIQYSQLDNFKK